MGLINMNARVYEPLLGRFLSPDSIIPGALTSQSYNRYTYLNNNPVNDVDPTGHCGRQCLRDIETRGVGGARVALGGRSDLSGPQLYSIYNIRHAQPNISACKSYGCSLSTPSQGTVDPRSGPVSAPRPKREGGPVFNINHYVANAKQPQQERAAAALSDNGITPAQWAQAEPYIQEAYRTAQAIDDMSFGFGDVFRTGWEATFVYFGGPLASNLLSVAKSGDPLTALNVGAGLGFGDLPSGSYPELALRTFVNGISAELDGGNFTANAAAAGMGNHHLPAIKDLTTEFIASIEQAHRWGAQASGAPTLAQQISGVTNYVERIVPGGRWDYKSRREFGHLPGIEAFGNFAFGTTAAAWADGYTGGLSNMFPEVTTNLLLRGAGAFQMFFQEYNPSNGKFYDWSSPAFSNYGDQFADQINIQWGAEYYFRRRARE